MDLLRRSIAEAVGTFALVFAGCGAIVVEAQTGALGHAGVSAVFGLVIAVMVFADGMVENRYISVEQPLAETVLTRIHNLMADVVEAHGSEAT